MFNTIMIANFVSIMLTVQQQNFIVLHTQQSQKYDVVSLKVNCNDTVYHISIMNNSVKPPFVESFTFNEEEVEAEKYMNFSNFISKARRIDLSTPECNSNDDLSFYASGSIIRDRPKDLDDDFNMKFLFSFK